jgi:hypothetical protein
MDGNSVVIGTAVDPTVAPERALCMTCGYELRGLKIDQRCPECGVSIARSLRGDLLIDSDPEYVRTLRRGAGLALLGMVVFVVLYAAVLAFSGAMPAKVVGVALEFGAFVGTVVYCAGWWLLTAPDMRQHADDRAVMTRRLARAAAGVVAGLATVLFVCALADMPGTGLGAAAQAIRTPVGMLEFAAIVASIVFGTTLVAELARRVPSRQLVSRARTIRGGVILAAAGLLVMAVLGAILRNQLAGNATVSAVLGVLSLVTGLLLIAEFLLYFSLLTGLRRELSEVLDASRWETVVGLVRKEAEELASDRA